MVKEPVKKNEVALFQFIAYNVIKLANVFFLYLHENLDLNFLKGVRWSLCEQNQMWQRKSRCEGFYELPVVG